MKSECLDSGIRQKEQWFDNDVSALSRHALWGTCLQTKRWWFSLRKLVFPQLECFTLDNFFQENFNIFYEQIELPLFYNFSIRLIVQP